MKIGILGGSFNPVHTGHVRMALEVLERLGLERVELVPAANPPHKSARGMLPFEQRLALVDLAVKGVDGLFSSHIEGRRAGPSYTCDTLNCYVTEQPSDDFYFIMGVGTFMELHRWKSGLELMTWANLVCVNRWLPSIDRVRGYVAENWPDAALETDTDTDEPVWAFENGKKLHYLEIPRLDIKGGDVRQRWRKGRSLSLLVPPGVEAVLECGGPMFDESWGKRNR